jgi:hypothetical protein
MNHFPQRLPLVASALRSCSWLFFENVDGTMMKAARHARRASQ